MPRATCYYQPQPERAENLHLMRQLDELYLRCPFLGSRKMAPSSWRSIANARNG